MADYGIEVFNNKGELFYSTQMAGEYMTFYSKTVLNPNKGNSYWDSGIPSGEKCVMFFKYTRGGSGQTCVGTMEQRNGTWQAYIYANDYGATLYIYTFSSLTPPYQAHYDYGIEVRDENGRVVVHNTARPLVCHVYNASGSSRPTPTFPAASSGTLLGVYRAERQHAIAQTNNNIIDIVRVPANVEDADYTTLMMLIDTTLYD